MAATRSLAGWLRRLEALNQAHVDLGLARVQSVLGRLPVKVPRQRVFTVAGTNGKGSTAGILDLCLRSAGYRVGRYTSPHLRRFNERIQIAGREIADDDLVAALAAVEVAAGDIGLTYFEFGTLAALAAFSRAGCDAWVLEVGLGGRLDAVNAIDPDLSLITTIGLDHQEYLGDTIEAIAAEKAGILRSGRPALFGDAPVPQAIVDQAARLGAPLACFGREFGYRFAATHWEFWSGTTARTGLPLIQGWTGAQYRNASLALTGLAAADIGLLPPAGALAAILPVALPSGRFQGHHRPPHDWILDVAHNPQAAAVLAAQLATLPAADTTVVVGLLADKSVSGFVAGLQSQAHRWIATGLEGPRGQGAADLAAGLEAAGAVAVTAAGSPAEAFTRAVQETPAGGRIVVCGSFRIVGPALELLGL